MRHNLKRRPEGRLQCTRCRAAYSTPESAALSAVPCYREPLPHGHRYDREHVLYPLSYDRGTGMGPDRLCDEGGCICINHNCDCDVCRDVLDAPGLKVLMDSQEEENRMTEHTIEIRLPAPIRKHVERVFVARDDQGDYDLLAACKAMGAGKSNNTLPVALTHGALGSLLRISRELAHSDNGGESLGARSILKNYEEKFVPLDPREIRHSINLPVKLLEDIRLHAHVESAGNGVRAEIHAIDHNRKGRFSNETLGWLLERFGYVEEAWRGQPVSRAAAKFRSIWAPVWQETDGKIRAHQSTDKAQEAAPAVGVRQPAESGLAWERRPLARCLNPSGTTYFNFGGCDKKGPTNPTLVACKWLAGKGGQNNLTDVDSQEVVATLHSSRVVWYAPIPKVVEPIEDQADEHDGREPEDSPASEREPARVWGKASLGTAFADRRERVDRRWYGGSGREPQDPVIVTAKAIGQSRNTLTADDGTVIATVFANKIIWSAPVDEDARVIADQEPEEAQAQEPPAKLPQQRATRREVPLNWLDLAQNADTQAARDWWYDYCVKYEKGLV